MQDLQGHILEGLAPAQHRTFNKRSNRQPVMYPISYATSTPGKRAQRSTCAVALSKSAHPKRQPSAAQRQLGSSLRAAQREQRGLAPRFRVPDTQKDRFA